MGFSKSLKKAAKSVTKSVSKTVKSGVSAIKSVVNTAVDVTKGIASGEYLLKAVGAVVSFAGNEILDDALGLDSIGKEADRVGNQFTQVGKVLGGDYHDDVKKIQELGNVVSARIDSYNLNMEELSNRLDDLIAFHEIFQIAIANRIDKYQEMYEPEIQQLIKEYEDAINRLKSEYDFVINLTQGAFIQRLIGSVIMIIGGIMSDFKEIMSGNGNGETWKRLITTLATVIGVILLLFIPGLQGVALIVAVSLAAIASFMALDGMYANGAATGAIMGLLDFMFNDLLNLDDLIGSDFDNFDKDSDDYQKMVMLTQIATSLGSVYTAWVNGGSAGANAVNSGMSEAPSINETLRLPSEGGINNSLSNASSISANEANTILGISKSTYSGIYKAYNAASSVKDILNQKQAYDAMIEKFTEDRLKLETALTNGYRKNFMKHYKDVAYFLQDQQEFIDRYIWSMTSQNMYVDPYGTTPVANIRFEPDKDTRGMSFGFEDVFSESKQAGSRTYFNNIIYGG